jgi:hypothetical protein
MNDINRLNIKNKNQDYVDQAHKQVDIDTRSIVIGDMENFPNSLLSHTEEDNCTHSLMDLLDEFFDKNSVRGMTTPNLDTNTTIQTHTHRIQTHRRGDDEL